MSKSTLATGTSPFAHLMAGFRGKRAEDDKPEDEEARKARRAEEDERREEEDARRAEEDERRREEDARRAEEDGSDEEGKRAEEDEERRDDDARRAEEDEETRDDPNARKAFQRGLALGSKRELERCAAIFASPAAAGKADLAAALAFGKEHVSADTAISLLGNVNARTRSRGLSDRMSGRNDPNPGADTAPDGKPTLANQMLAVGKRLGLTV